jgi:PAS domain S-box-containing protein
MSDRDVGLAETEGVFRTLVEESTDIVMIVDPDGTIRYVTPSAERVLKRTPDELVGSRAFDPIHPEDADRVLGRFGEMMATPGARASVEFRYERGDGEWIWAEARGKNLVEDSNVEGAVVYTRDITDRRERERELRQQQAFTEASLESVADVYWVIDPEGYVTRWSDDDGSVTGYTREEAIGTHSSAFHPDEQVPRIREAIEEIKREGWTEVEADLERKDGSHVPYHVTGTAITDDEGTVRSMCGVGRDITDQKRREAELQRQTERLEELVDAVSHDLRNPLNVIEGRLDLAEETGDAEQFERCREALDRMETLIDDLLALGRLGESVDPAERKTVRLEAIVSRCWETVRTGEGTVEVASDTTVEADEDRLRHLFENLFRNAVEHGSGGERSTTDGDGVTVTVGALPHGFFIEDDGPGIPAAEREEVFERGYSTEEDGSGIGLAIVREVTEAHGWDVDVTGGDPGGARFEITGVGSG